MKALLLALTILSAIHGSAASGNTTTPDVPGYWVRTCYKTNNCGQHDRPKWINISQSIAQCAPGSCKVETNLPWQPYCDTKCMPDLTTSMSYAESAMTEYPYVVEQTYNSSNCSGTPNVRYYAAKDTCIGAGDGNDASWSITGTGDIDWIKYDGANCSGDPISGFRVSAADVSGRNCIDRPATIYSIGGVTLQKERRYVAATYYNDSTCSTALYIDYRLEATSVDWDCSTSISNCQLLPDGTDHHYGTVTCIPATNYTQFAASVFGSLPYMIAMRYYNANCSVDYGLVANRADRSAVDGRWGRYTIYRLCSDQYTETTYIYDGESIYSMSESLSDLETKCIEGKRYYPYNVPANMTCYSSKLKSSFWALLLGFVFSILL